MEKTYMVFGLAVLAVALAFTGAQATNFGASGSSVLQPNSSMGCNTADLAGAIVKNSRGDVIGIVNRVENDGGQAFAIVNHGPDSYYGDGGGFTPVPLNALKNEGTDPKLENATIVVLNKTEKQLEAAPAWDPTKMDSRQYEARIDSFYGVQPTFCS